MLIIAALLGLFRENVSGLVTLVFQKAGMGWRFRDGS